MSRSRKKNPYTGFTCANSERKDKKTWHSRFRAWARQMLLLDPEYIFRDCDRHQVSNPWGMAKDGKHYWDDPRCRRK
jgi:hypothetical protein